MATVTPPTGDTSIDATGDTSGATTGTTEAGTAPARRKRPVRLVAVVLGVPLLVAAIGYGLFMWLQPHAYSGTVMQAPTAAPSMEELTGTDGRPVDLSAYRGDVVVVYFGYTYCPDVCPTTLAMAARAREQLGGDADRVHVMMVSVDPARDTVERVGDYVAAFDPSFSGATGDLAAVERVAATYGVFFAKGEPLGDDGYAVDHTATLMAIDTEGKLRIVWPTDVTADALAADLGELL
jgi:protein SCO1/2